MEAYYFEHLPKEQKAVYHALLEGLRAAAPVIEAPRTEGGILGDIYAKLRLDHPELFYAMTFQYRAALQGSTVQVLPRYLFERKKLMTHRDAMSARAEKLCRPALDRSDEEKLLYIHDFVCGSVRYDKLKKEYSHEILGPLGQGVGVCEGIAKTVKLLCDRLGVWCVVALSDSNPGKNIKYRHTWNVVRLAGKFYHLDVTFDNSLGERGAIRYDYFLLDDARIFRDHEPVIWEVPACPDGTMSYYRTRKLSFTKPEEVAKRTAQALKKNRPLVFHWRGGYLTRDMLTELTGIIDREAAAVDRQVRVTVNRPQAVIRVIPGERSELVLEEANEGESCGG